MTVNVENINLMIAAISAQTDPIYMGGFVKRNSECGTTACLAGWANVLRLNQQGKGKSWDFESTDDASEWMGIDPYKGHNLFMDFRADELPEDERKAAAIALLTKLRDTGNARWDDVLPPELQD